MGDRVNNGAPNSLSWSIMKGIAITNRRNTRHGNRNCFTGRNSLDGEVAANPGNSAWRLHGGPAKQREGAGLIFSIARGTPANMSDRKGDVGIDWGRQRRAGNKAPWNPSRFPFLTRDSGRPSDTDDNRDNSKGDRGRSDSQGVFCGETLIFTSRFKGCIFRGGGRFCICIFHVDAQAVVRRLGSK